jgi:hypothetical protein
MKPETPQNGGERRICIPTQSNTPTNRPSIGPFSGFFGPLRQALSASMHPPVAPAKAVPAKPAAPKIRESGEIPDEQSSFQKALLSEVEIQSSPQNTYYVDEEWEMVGRFKGHPPARKRKVDAWHDKNRKTLHDSIGLEVDCEKDLPRARSAELKQERLKLTQKKALRRAEEIIPNFIFAISKTNLWAYLTPSARIHLVSLATMGQVCEESKWDQEATSNKECYGLWQMKAMRKNGKLEGVSKDIFLKKKETLGKMGFQINPDNDKNDEWLMSALFSPYASSIMAGVAYDLYWNNLKTTAEKVKKRYKFSSEESFQINFLIPMLICSYHNGAAGMEKKINDFLTAFPTATEKDPNEKDLAWEMIKRAYKEEMKKTKKEQRFGSYSVQYFLRVSAWRKINEQHLRAKVEESMKKLEKSELQATTGPIWKDQFKHDGPYGTGQSDYEKFLAQAKAEGLVSPLTNKEMEELKKAGLMEEIIDDGKQNFTIDRKKVKLPYLMEYARYVLFQIARDYYEATEKKLVISELFRTDGQPSIHQFGNSIGFSTDKNNKGVLLRILLKRQRRGEVMVCRGPKTLSIMVANNLWGNIPKILPPATVQLSPQRPQPQFVIAPLHQPAPRPRQEESVPNKNNFKKRSPYRGRGSNSILRAQAAKEKTKVLGDNIEEMLRAGTLVRVDDRNEKFVLDRKKVESPYLRPYALLMLRKIAQDFYTQSQGCKLIVTDLYRTAGDQINVRKKNSVATKNLSTHRFGNTFDITKNRIIMPNGKMKWTGEKIDLMRKVLVAHQEKGEIMILEENAAFHNMTAKPEG